MAVESTTVLIVGTGFSGLGAAIRLQQEGLHDFLLLDRAAALGGTWRDNRYPGAACDIASHLYSFSFELNPRWSRTYAGHAELRAYLEGCAEKHQLGPRIRYGAEVATARWADGQWTVTTTDGRVFVARFAIFGVGGLKDPRWPSLPGLDTFAGERIHTAAWPEGTDLRGKRVAVLGTGASAIQVVPNIADAASTLHVVQRTPPWIVPRQDRAYGEAEKTAFAQVPGLMRGLRTLLYALQEARYPLIFQRSGLISRLFMRLMRQGIAAEVTDPATARALTPTYAAGCKRILISSDYYPTFNKPHVHLHTEAVAAVQPGGLRLASGRLLEVDTLIAATGFSVDAPLGAMEVFGKGGQSLSEFWGIRPRAYLGVTAPGFPNAFLLLGPNTALGHNSVVIMIEAQVEYVLQAIAATRARGHRATVELRAGRLEAFVAEVDRALSAQVWASGCQSWYLNSAGQNFTIWPGSTLSYRWRVRRFDEEAYSIHTPA
jgi:cation diffusion facilitator CzcD-associated flavoprotein CzcO